ncbi:putative AMP-dependent synthetase and ligase [Candidatus Terasakiella magnetica]|nr:putative AMP-dependent synthetase and ligase [Candidatus Terasakiella magnetica]
MSRFATLLAGTDYPARLVAWRGDERITLAAFRRDVAALARHLRQNKVQRVGLICPDAYGFAVGLFAALAAGAVAVVPSNTRPQTLVDLQGDTDTVVGEHWASVAGEAAALPLFPASTRLEFQTSGSTGRPKAVVKTLAQFETEALALERLWGARVAAAPVLATVPPHHVYGLTFRIMWPLLSGRAFDVRTHDVWETVLAALPADAFLVSSPAHLTRLAGIAALAAGRRPRLVLSAGAPLPFEAAREAQRVLGRLPDEIYGSTENGAIATRRQENAAMAWRALPGVDCRVEEAGHLALRSPWAEGGGWVATADLAESGGEGFHLRGRADRIAKIEGKRVGLDEVEGHLTALPQIDDAAAVVLEEGDAALLAALVVLSPTGREEAGSLGLFRFTRLLRRLLADRLEPAGLPRRWRIVDAIPSTAMGKRPAALLAAAFVVTDPPRLPDQGETRRLPDGTVEMELGIRPDLLWFRGHFPDLPILPGVVLVDWAIRYAQCSAPAFQIKFKAPVLPGDALVLTLPPRLGKTRQSFEYRRGSEVVCSGVLRWS